MNVSGDFLYKNDNNTAVIKPDKVRAMLLAAPQSS